MAQHTTDPTEPQATVADMREAVGSLFMLWSRVEADLAEAVAKLIALGDADKPHGIGRTLATWKALHDAKAESPPEHHEITEALHAQLQEALRIRNCIAHGLEGYGVTDRTGSAGPYFRCRLKDEPEVITLEYLRACLSRLAGARTHIGRLTHAALHPGEPGLESLYDDVAELMGRKEG